MFDFFRKLFDTADFPARWQCGQWSSAHGWLHIASDLAVFGAYLAIPCVLVYSLLKYRNLALSKVVWLFGAFILACGTGHLIEATLFWEPWYRLSGVVKAITAVVSWATVFALISVGPRVLQLPGLVAEKARLEEEIREARAAEACRLEEAERLQLHADELEAFSNSVVEREERVMELKHEVDDLLAELDRDPRYSSTRA
jgi:hypothetical protein